MIVYRVRLVLCVVIVIGAIDCFFHVLDKKPPVAYWIEMIGLLALMRLDYESNVK